MQWLIPLIFGLIALIGITIFVVWHSTRRLSAKNKITSRVSLAGTITQAGTAAVLAIGLVFTWQSISGTLQNANDTLIQAQEQTQEQQFKDAVAQLTTPDTPSGGTSETPSSGVNVTSTSDVASNSADVESRLAGIYVLEHLSTERPPQSTGSPPRFLDIMRLLASYLELHSRDQLIMDRLHELVGRLNQGETCSAGPVENLPDDFREAAHGLMRRSGPSWWDAGTHYVLDGDSLQYLDVGRGRLRDAFMVGVNLQCADDAYTNQQANTGFGVDFRGAALGGSSLDCARLINADFRSTSESRSSVFGTSFMGADLQNARFDTPGLNAQHADFRNSDLSGANFAGADLRGAQFNGARLTGADFTGANIAGAYFTSGERPRGARGEPAAAQLSSALVGYPTDCHR